MGKKNDSNYNNVQIQFLDNDNIPILQIPDEEHIENDIEEMEKMFRKFQKQTYCVRSWIFSKTSFKRRELPNMHKCIKS